MRSRKCPRLEEVGIVSVGELKRLPPAELVVLATKEFRGFGMHEISGSVFLNHCR